MNLKVYFLTIVGSGILLLAASSALVLTIRNFSFPKFSQPSKSTQNIAVNNPISEPSPTAIPTPRVNVKQPGTTYRLSLPYHTFQTFNNCGPATLSMIFYYFGQQIDQFELGNQMRPYQIPSGDNDDKSVNMDEFVLWSEKYGMKGIYRVDGDITLMKTFLTNDIPVIVRTHLNTEEDIGHYRILKGYDDINKTLFQDDSYQGKDLSYSYDGFNTIWAPFNYEYVVVYKPEQEELVKAILGEEIDPQVAYKNALVRAQKEVSQNPNVIYPYLNIAQSQYHLGNYQEAASAYEKVEYQLPSRTLWYILEPYLIYQKLGNYEKVFAMIDGVLNNANRAYSELYQIRGEIYLSQGDKEAARREFEQAVFYNKNYEPAQKSLQTLY